LTAAAPFTKMQAVGNDFVVVEAAEWPEGTDWPALAQRVCDRHFGVGGDGLLVVSGSDRADVRMRMYNPDGTEDMCGNGLRCVIRFAAGRGTLGERGTVETIAGVRPFALLPDGRIDADMGIPRFAPPDLPMKVSGERVVDFPLDVCGELLPVTVVSTGTTHTVVFVDELPGDERFFLLSPHIEHHPAFPERTSVMWTRVAGPDRLELRIWERGAGETLGCGTGSCAAAVAAQVTRRVAASQIAVASKGGELEVRWRPTDAMTIHLIGGAEAVYSGLLAAEPA
jgi:diaminopimelate epimerase